MAVAGVVATSLVQTARALVLKPLHKGPNGTKKGIVVMLQIII